MSDLARSEAAPLRILSHHRHHRLSSSSLTRFLASLDPRSAHHNHSLKATLALGILTSAPKVTIPAAAGSEVTDLIENILSKRGKDKEYSAGGERQRVAK